MNQVSQGKMFSGRGSRKKPLNNPRSSRGIRNEENCVCSNMSATRGFFTFNSQLDKPQY